MAVQRHHRIRRHVTYANVMSTAAVFLLLAGGTAYAATAAKGSVTSRSVKDNSLKSKDLKDGKAVGSADVIDSSLTGSDVADSSLTKADLGPGSVTAGELGPLVKFENPATIAANTTAAAIANCPAGSIAVSGGGRITDSGVNVRGVSRENVTQAWVFEVQNTNAAPVTVTAFVYCLAS